MLVPNPYDSNITAKVVNGRQEKNIMQTCVTTELIDSGYSEKQPVQLHGRRVEIVVVP